MSIIFGVRKAKGNAVTQQELLQLAEATQAYAPDGIFVTDMDHVGMGFQPFHTTRLSRLESQPLVSARKNTVVFDGRIDNRSQLLTELEDRDAQIPDSALVLAAFERWGENLFARLIGDWALALWCDTSQTLYLARDHAGTRTLYYQNAKDQLVWSTYLETFFADNAQHPLDEEYAAAFLCSSPIGDLTPYRDIRAVPPAHYLAIQGGRVIKRRHWQCVADSEIQYKSDTEYEEHFFALFKQAVERRTAIGDPILAQLSGGMDSTSIVCMSDHIRRAQGYAIPDLLDTVSYLSPDEPNWNEAPFIAATEKQRRKSGIHLEVFSSEAMFEAPEPVTGRPLLPGSSSATVNFEKRFRASVADREFRVILSGIGGDEVLGGVPTPAPELADYIARFELSHLFKQGLAWSLTTGNPMSHLLWGATTFALGLYWPETRPKRTAPSWIDPRLRKLGTSFGDADLSLRERIQARPSALSNGRAWLSALETLPNLYPRVYSRYEFRYPYLDRDLVDFLFRVPREQITRPGRRRSLMRRAMKELLPVKVLERKRKAYVSRGPLIALRQARHTITALLDDPLLAAYRLVDVTVLRRAMETILRGEGTTEWQYFMKTIAFERWLEGNSSCLQEEKHLRTRPRFLFDLIEQPGSAQDGL